MKQLRNKAFQGLTWFKVPTEFLTYNNMLVTYLVRDVSSYSFYTPLALYMLISGHQLSHSLTAFHTISPCYHSSVC